MGVLRRRHPGGDRAAFAQAAEPRRGGPAACHGTVYAAHGLCQQSLAEQAARWPVATGHIDVSGLQKFQIRDGLKGGGYRPWRTVFKSRVVYSYSVAGQRYAADRVAFGSNLTASLPGLVSGQSQRYVQGDKVEVHYDPANPAAAVLDCRMRGLWLLWVSASVFLAGAALLVGVF
nr:DUF3592 domain-containing protein [Mesorhizobium sp.]